jgi:hypothetical protein
LDASVIPASKADVVRQFLDPAVRALDERLGLERVMRASLVATAF